jgi:hypothetical protein
MLTAATIAIRTITRTAVTVIRGQAASTYGYAYSMENRAGAHACREHGRDGETRQGQLTSAAARQIVGYHLNRYFEMVEARIPAALARGRAMISA